MNPYRVAQEVSAGAGPAELVCVAMDRERRGLPGVAALQLLMLPGTAFVALATLLTPNAGLAGAIATAVLVGWWWRRAHANHDCVLRVDDGALTVSSRKSRLVKTTVRLVDLMDVGLDTKTIQRVGDGGGMIPALRFVEGRVAPEVDISRIVLVEADGTSTALGEKYMANSDATEWLGRIRVFLRKQGWVPGDERPEASEAPPP